MTGAAAVIDLSVWQLAGAVLLVGVIIAVSIRQALGLERDLMIGSLRTMAQLYGVGLMLVGMTAVATQAAVSHLKTPIPGGHRIAATAMSSLLFVRLAARRHLTPAHPLRRYPV
jgi:hypothetical protein